MKSISLVALLEYIFKVFLSITRCDRYCFQCQTLRLTAVSQSTAVLSWLIGCEFSYSWIVTSSLGHHPSQHDVLADLARASCHIYGRKFDIKHNLDLLKTAIQIGRSKDSRQVIFCSVNAVYFFIKLGSLNCTLIIAGTEAEYQSNVGSTKDTHTPS